MDCKFDLEKLNKGLFQGKPGEVTEIFCKKAYYITLDGVGDPATDQRYHQAIETLYNLAYTLKFMYKQKEVDFVDMPLSTLLWKESGENLTAENRNTWNWRAMIEIPSYVTEDSIALAKEKSCKKEEGTLARAVLPREMNEGNAFQVLHVGGYDELSTCIEALHRAIEAAGYPCRGRHHEIYLNDPAKVEKSKLKTLIRQPVFKEADEVLDFEVSKQQVFDMIGIGKAMVLSTTDGSKVSSRNMSIISDQGKFYFQTALKFRKCKDIEKNKNVALCVNNLQIEGQITAVYSFYDAEAESFKELYQQYHAKSYHAYSKLMGNRVFEITPQKISLFKYRDKDGYQEFIDLEKKSAYRRWYVVN